MYRKLGRRDIHDVEFGGHGSQPSSWSCRIVMVLRGLQVLEDISSCRNRHPVTATHACQEDFLSLRNEGLDSRPSDIPISSLEVGLALRISEGVVILNAI